MKHKTHFLYYLFRPDLSGLASLMLRRSGLVSSLTNRSGLIIIALLLCNAIATAQEQTPPPKEFVLDAYMSYPSLSIDPIYNSYIECGFNTMTQRATIDSKPLLEDFNLHAINMADSTDWIYYYSSSYYSKWEAEEDQTDKYKVGYKHRDTLGNLIGSPATYLSTQCWSSKGLTSARDSLIYGPSYHQEKFYKRWLYMDIYDLKYTPRFRMALTKHPSVPDTQDVCRLYVLLKYRRIVDDEPDSTDSTYVLKEPITLKVSDFPSNGDFDYFYFSDFMEERSYEYPSWMRDPITDKLILPEIEGIYRDDKWGGTGVQFCVDWLRTDTLCTLYIDNIEVYDNDGWNKFIIDPEGRAQDIVDYAQNYSDWTNIKYWMGGHEPATIDSYTPIKTVNAILESVGAPPLMNTVWVHWNQDLNGESQLERYYNTVQPNKLLVEFHPIQSGYDVPPPFAFEVLRRIFQESYSLTQKKKFYYHVQSYGQWKDNAWYVLRRPSVPEYKTTVMLALAHGADGLVQASYDSQPWDPNSGYPGIYGLIGIAPDYDLTDLWYELKDNLIPRIKGKLGKTLMTLNYTGDYLYLGRYLQNLCCGFTNSGPTVTERYLTLTEYVGESTPPPVHFHAGFFESPNQGDNYHFHLTNLITTGNRVVNVRVTNDCSVYLNNRFRNIEPEENFDTTFTCEFSTDMLFPPGEGYLYQVAPVIKYGGRLLYSEATQPGMILYDDMIIENGAVLTINGVYASKGNIIIKNGGIVNGDNGKIHFVADKKLIIEGNGTITGSPGNKLELTFSGSQNEFISGIMIKPGGSLTISNCKIEDATIGIESTLNANYLYAQAVDFINCETHSISIAGRSPGIPQTPIPQINNCTMSNSEKGIWITNLSGVLIQYNNITNTDLGIYLSNVTDAQIIGNGIHSSTEALEGIISISSGGVIRGNGITGHTVGIHLANSSPKLGGNRIYYNRYHGLYIGSGSRPNMRSEFAGNPPITYAISGYNEIKENGGYEDDGGPADNDGSEIYFNNSNAVMSKGCNSIYDNREPEPPLINTLLLMNCPAEGHPIYVDARGNYWGNRVSEERFGNLRVDFIPYLDQPCPEPQGGSADELVRMTSFGDVIDTVYSVDAEVPELTETEVAYAEAEEYFLTGDLTNALQIYESIINSNASVEEKYFSYERKYEIGKLSGQSSEFFNQLSSTFSTLAANSQDTLNTKILNQLSTLSKVGEQEYESAINEFDVVIQQNPNTEEAVYAEIDALTTALLVEGEDSTLQKGRLGKYLIKTSSDYNQRVDEILRKNFGGKSKETKKELLPTEYTLYQNYPNPFNPTTTIKYDLPNASEVSLIIYDILGRKVKELVNVKQQAGRYEVQFNASNLASGVYVYQLIAEKYMSSRKMILLR